MANKAREKAAVKAPAAAEPVIIEMRAAIQRLGDAVSLKGLAAGLSDGEFARRVRMLGRDEAHDELIALGARVRDLEALLARVRCYAVVDPLGNPGALGAARMVGIERDIDDACDRRRRT